MTYIHSRTKSTDIAEGELVRAARQYGTSYFLLIAKNNPNCAGIYWYKIKINPSCVIGGRRWGARADRR